MAQRNVTISVNISGRNDLANTLKQIREQTRLTADYAADEVEKIVKQNFSNLEKMLRNIRVNRDDFAKNFSQEEMKRFEERTKAVQLKTIQVETKRAFFENPDIARQAQKNAQQDRITSINAAFDSIKSNIGEGPMRMNVIQSREMTGLLKAQYIQAKQKDAEDRMLRYREDQARYGRIGGAAKYYAEEMNQRLPLSWLIGLKAGMVGSQFAGNTPYTAGTLSSSTRLLTGEMALIFSPAVYDLIKVMNFARQGLRDMSPAARSFAETSAKFALWGSLGAIALKTIFSTVGAGVSVLRTARDWISPIMENGQRMPLAGNWLSRRGMIGAAGLGLAGAGMFAYGANDDSFFGQAVGASGSGLMAGAASRAFGFSNRLAGGIGLAVGAADFGRRMLFPGNPVLPGLVNNNPAALLDNDENRRLRREIAGIMASSNDPIEIANGFNTGASRAGRLQAQLLGRYGINAQQLGLNPEMLGSMNQENLAHLQSIILNAISGRRQVPGYIQPPGARGGGEVQGHGPGVNITLPGWNGDIMSPHGPRTPQQEVEARRLRAAIRQQLINEQNLGLFQEPAPVDDEDIDARWRTLFRTNPRNVGIQQQQQGPAGQITRRDALNLLDNQSFNFQGSQEIDIGSMHSVLQGQVIRDPSQNQDFQQVMRDLQGVLNRINQGAPGVLDQILGAISNFNNAVRPIGNALNR
jgi:hypothetical protein